MTLLRPVAVAAYLSITLIFLGALIFDLVALYPSFFHDVPRSLAVSAEFMAVSGPGDFFRPLGPVVLALGVAALVAVWRDRVAAGLVATSVVVLLLANGVFSALYFWPANTVMFTEGLAVHSAEHLRAVADGFVRWNVVRVVATALAPSCAFVAAVRFHTAWVLPRHSTTPAPAADSPVSPLRA